MTLSGPLTGGPDAAELPMPHRRHKPRPRIGPFALTRTLAWLRLCAITGQSVAVLVCAGWMRLRELAKKPMRLIPETIVGAATGQASIVRVFRGGKKKAHGSDSGAGGR